MMAFAIISLMVILVLFLDALFDGDILGKFWCRLGRHRFYTYKNRTIFNSGKIIPLNYCAFCGKLEGKTKRAFKVIKGGRK